MKKRQKIAFSRWILYGANSAHIKRLYADNHHNGKFDEAGFLDELEDFLTSDNVEFDEDSLMMWLQAKLYPIPLHDIRPVIFD